MWEKSAVVTYEKRANVFQKGYITVAAYRNEFLTFKFNPRTAKLFLITNTGDVGGRSTGHCKNSCVFSKLLLWQSCRTTSTSSWSSTLFSEISEFVLKMRQNMDLQSQVKKEKEEQVFCHIFSICFTGKLNLYQ